MDHVQPPWPDQKGDEKLLVWGPTEDGRLLQVIFTLKHPDEVAFEALTMEEWAGLGENDRIVYVVHAMELLYKMSECGPSASERHQADLSRTIVNDLIRGFGADR